MSNLKNRIIQESSNLSHEQRKYGLIGRVVNYHPESKVCSSKCEEHKGGELEDSERHTADVIVTVGKQEQELKRVPCMVYSQGIVNNGLRPNDRVWVQFVNGDVNLPVITGFYRDPSKWEIMANTFKFTIGNIFAEMIGVK